MSAPSVDRAGDQAGNRSADRTTDRALGSWDAVRLVAGREISTRVRSKAFLWTTVVLVAGVVLGGVLIHLVGAAAGTKHVGLTPEAQDAAAQVVAIGDAVGTKVETVDVPDAATGRAQVADGTLDALVTSTSPELTVTVHRKVDTDLEPVLGALSQQLALARAVSDLGGDPAQVAQQIGDARAQVTAIEPERAQDGGQIVAGYATGILLFITLLGAGQLVATGVVEEKSSRVVELLLATLRPWQLMTGKVLGIGLVGLAQMVLVVGAAVGTAFGLGLLDTSSLDLGLAAVWALVWFVVGFATVAFLLAAGASLVSRQEDVGSVNWPISVLLIVPYVIGVSIAPWDPDNPLVVWLSFVPFCAPMLMPIRVALGSVDAWEVWLSLGISLALIPLLVWLAARIYARGVLYTGGRVKLTDALRS